nr:hypothetical protein [Tanacetum cinerariifolium]
MLLEGSELAKEHLESQLYDDFEHFRQHKGKSIHDYYVRFSKLINDMRNIQMTMSKLQLNSKFVNNMLPEWGRFLTAVKLNRELRDSNYDQLYAYLKQHETHAKENKMMLERFSQHTVDPLALLLNISNPHHYSPSSSALTSIQVPPPFADPSSPAEDLIENLTNTLALLTQSYRTFLPQTNNQLRTSSNARNQATVQDGRVGQARPSQARTVKCYNCNGTGHIARNYTQPKQPQNSEYFKDKMLLMQAQENGVALDAEQLLFLASGHDNAFDDDIDEQPAQDLALNVDNVFQADECDAFDLDVDEAPTAQTMFTANLSSADPVTDKAGPSYDSDILSEVQDHNQYMDDVFAHHEEHVMYNSVQLDHVVDSHADYTSDRNMIPYDQYLKNNEDFKQKENKYLKDFLDMKSLKEKVEDKLINQDQSLQTVHMLCRPRPNPNELNRVAIGYKNPLCLTRAKQVQPALYNCHEIIKDSHKPTIVHDTEDTLEIAEITRKKMNDKMNNPECVTRKVKIAPHDYSKENLLATFTPQKQLTPEQIFWSNDLMKLKSEALKERTKRITPTWLTEGERGFEQTKACYLQEVILFFKTLKDNFEGIQKALTKEVKEMKDVFEELEAELKYQNLKDNIGNNPPTPDKDTPDFDSVFVIGKMQASLQVKENVIRQLKKQLSQLQVTRSDTDRTLQVQTTDSQISKLNDQVTHLQAQNDLFRAETDKIKPHHKELYDSIKITRAKHIEQVTKLTTENVNLKTSVSKATINPQVSARDKHAIDVEPIIPRLRNNKDAHLDYLRHLKESVEIIRDIVEEAKVVRPRDRSIVSTCRYTKHSQELLEYAIGTCPQGSQQRAK